MYHLDFTLRVEKAKELEPFFFIDHFITERRCYDHACIDVLPEPGEVLAPSP